MSKRTDVPTWRASHWLISKEHHSYKVSPHKLLINYKITWINWYNATVDKMIQWIKYLAVTILTKWSKLVLPILRHGSEVKSLSRVRLFATPWTVAYQAVHGIFQARILEQAAISFSKLNFKFNLNICKIRIMYYHRIVMRLEKIIHVMYLEQRSDLQHMQNNITVIQYCIVLYQYW